MTSAHLIGAGLALFVLEREDAARDTLRIAEIRISYSCSTVTGQRQILAAGIADQHIDAGVKAAVEERRHPSSNLEIIENVAREDEIDAGGGSRVISLSTMVTSTPFAAH